MTLSITFDRKDLQDPELVTDSMLAVLLVEDTREITGDRHYLLLDGRLFEIKYAGFEWVDRDFHSLLELINFWIEQLTAPGEKIILSRCPWGLPGNREYERIPIFV